MRGRWVWPTIGVAVVLALSMVVAGLANVALDFFGGDRSPGEARAGAALMTAGATLLLVVGSGAAAWFLWGSLSEAKASREAGLRPQIVVDFATLDTPEPVAAEFVLADSVLYASIRNVGPGPALGVDACDCDERHLDLHPRPNENLYVGRASVEGGVVVLGPGESERVFVWSVTVASTTGGPPASEGSEPSVHFLYKDVFGNVFRTPIETQEKLEIRAVPLHEL